VGLLGIEQYILGIKPLKPQYELIQIRPLDFHDSLSAAAGTLPTDRGDITVEWDHNDSRFLMTLTIPDNMTAKVYVPKSGTTGAAIKVDGNQTTGTEESDYVYVENIGSGTHTFERAAQE
jgi:alpha-L-rhamnosidase